ncbi:putative Ig domain-containing protein [Acrocarpospora corrugata]|uniref:putative Ig domain-containing protein n=1 Tax=Acrocarpospora corrugata TaxID=35763 RepID=UPI0024838BEB|nr:putative Ig domain-containing protein [Acrocarpospora corrugata]
MFAPEGEPLGASIPAADVDGGPLTYTVTDPAKLPPGLTLGGTGQLSAAAMPEGVYDVPVKVCDSEGACAAGTVRVSTYLACADLGNKRCRHLSAPVTAVPEG